jgi:hypothetical protein
LGWVFIGIGLLFLAMNLVIRKRLLRPVSRLLSFDNVDYCSNVEQ